MITSRNVSSLEKILHDSEPTCASLSEMSMLGNERASFQLAYFSDEDTQCGISVSGWRPENIKIYKVVEINSDLPAFEDSDFYFLRKTPGLYPDMLEPVEDNSFFAESGHHGFKRQRDRHKCYHSRCNQRKASRTGAYVYHVVPL